QRLRKRLSAQAAALCVPEPMLAAFHPLMQISTLALFDGRRDGFDAGFGQEIALAALAHAQGREIVALEKVGEQMAALVPADAALAARLSEQGLGQLERGEARGSLRALAEVWERGDLARLASYEQWCDCVGSADERRWLRGMNDGRNPQLARRIAALHAAGRPVLVAVGALHMTGPQALPLLLQRAGFQVERVVPR
ncbi:MAG: TraB/GumN family protein, partial [Burkholderiaceae bacterium]